MFFVKFIARRVVETGHLQTIDFESSAVDVINYFAHRHIAVWLDQSEGTLSLVLEVIAGLDITVVCNF